MRLGAIHGSLGCVRGRDVEAASLGVGASSNTPELPRSLQGVFMDQSFGGPMPDPLVRGDEFLDLSWEMFGELCRALAMRVGREYRPEMVVGIARAGVIPAAILASILRVDFYSMKISRRDGGDVVRESPTIFSAAPQQAAGKRVILLDEITTSGETFRLGLAALRNVGCSEIGTGAVFVRPLGYRPNYYALETDATVLFPWDRKVFDGEEWVVNPRYEAALEE